MLIYLNQNDITHKLFIFYISFDSSVGRAVDCSSAMSDIHRSLVQIRLEGIFFNSTQFLFTILTRGKVNAAILFGHVKVAICCRAAIC